MSSQFERWWDMERARVLSGRHSTLEACKLAWDTSTQNAIATNDVILELTKHVDNLNDMLAVSRQVITQLSDMLPVTDTRKSDYTNFVNMLDRVSNTTPKQSLKDYRNSVIEQCAIECDKQDSGWADVVWNGRIKRMSNIIRNLKDDQ